MPSSVVFPRRSTLRLPRPGVILRGLSGKRRLPGDRPAWLERVAAGFGVAVTGPLQMMQGGLRNEAWILPTPQGRKLLKRYKKTLEYEQLVHEHSVLEHLAKAAFPSPRLIRTAAGETILHDLDRYYAMFDFLEGFFRFDSYFYLPSRSNWFLAAQGSVLAGLHSALEGFQPAGRNLNGFRPGQNGRYREVGWFLEKLQHSRQRACDLPQSPAFRPVATFLFERAGWVADTLLGLEERLDAAGLGRQMIHGDFGPYNLMVKPGQPVMVMDFELARLDWRSVDLISALSSAIPRHKGEYDLQAMRRLVNAYQAINPLPVDELRLLPDIWQFMVLRRVITCVDEYVRSGSSLLLNEFQRRMRRSEWVGLHRQELAWLA